MNTLVNHNGTLMAEKDAVLSASNRSFRYGDGLFETIRVIKGKPCFLDFHVKRLIKGMGILKMNVPANFNPVFFENSIIALISANAIDGDARVRLSVYRNDGGFYTPVSNDVSFLIEAEPISEQGYELNIKGYEIDVYHEIKKPSTIFSTLKTANGLPYVMAGVFRKQQNLDECIILNDKGNIIEGISYNIFAVKNGVLYTPPISDGCVDGIMRWQIIKIATENRIAVYEINLALNVLLNSDELFFTNALNGIRWIGTYKAKHYTNNISKLLVQKLNAKVEELV